MTKLTDASITKVTSLDDEAIFYAVDLTRAINDQDVKIEKQDLLSELSPTLQDVTEEGATTDQAVTIENKLAVGDGTNPFSADLAVNTNDSNAFPVVFSLNNDASGTIASFYGFSNLTDYEGTADLENARAQYNRLRLQGSHVNRAIGLYNELEIEDNGTDSMLLAYGITNRVETNGTNTQTIDFLLGTDNKIVLLNPNMTYNNMYGQSIDITLSDGNINSFAGLRIDLDQDGGTISDGAYLYFGTGIDLAQAQANGILVIESDLDLPSFLAGGLEAKEFIKTGATSDDILLGDGSTTSLSSIVDTSEWATFTGTRAGGDLDVTIGDYDNSGNGTRLYINSEFDYMNVYTASFQIQSGIISILDGPNGTSLNLNPNTVGNISVNLPTSSGTIALTTDELKESNVFSDVFEGNTGASISLDISSYRSFILTVNQNTVITTDTTGLANSKSCSFSAIVTGNFTVDLSAYTISPSSDTYDGTIDNRLIFDVYKKSNGTTIQIVTVENLS